MQQRNLSILSQQTTIYTTTNAWANVPGFVITVPEDGNYDVWGVASAYNDANADVTTTRLALNGALLNGCESDAYCNVSLTIQSHTHIMLNVSLKAGDVVSLQAMYTSSSTQIVYQAGARGAIQIVKRGL